VLAVPINSEDILVFELPGGVRFAFEAYKQILVLLARKNFDRDGAPHFRIVSFINEPKTAAPNLGFYFVFADITHTPEIPFRIV
jgi:hypothetical protein